MAENQLYQFLKDEGHTLAEIAEKTGYRYQYVCGLLNGSETLTDSARLRFIRAYPETARILLPELAPASQRIDDDWEPGDFAPLGLQEAS